MTEYYQEKNMELISFLATEMFLIIDVLFNFVIIMMTDLLNCSVHLSFCIFS
jgi:hypothetical protein